MNKIAKVSAIIIAIALMLSSITVAAEETVVNGTCGENLIWTLDKESGLLEISGTGDMDDGRPWLDEVSFIYIYSVVIDEGVTSIGAQAFSNCQRLISVQLPSTLKTIGDDAFNYCIALPEIEIPDSVTSLGDSVFTNCQKLTYVYLPDSITSMGISVFTWCSSLTSVHLPTGITALPNDTFSNCKSLVSFEIPDHITSLGLSAFESCSNLVSLTIPESVVNLGQNSFSNTSITEIYVPAGVTNIFDNCFANTSKLTNIIVSENNANYSSVDGVLFDKSGTKLIKYPRGKEASKYTVPTGTTSIGQSSFANHTYLSEIEFPETVTSIGLYAFQGCKNISEIKLSENVKYINNYAFRNCSGLNKILILNPECRISDTEYAISDTAAIYGIAGSTAQAYAEKYSRTFVPVCLDGTENHSFDSSTTATCTEDGITTYNCSICGYTYEKDTAATGHSFTNYISNNDFSCTQDGTKTAECDNACGETDTVDDTGSATGHNYTQTVVAPSCTAQGYTEYICENCGDLYKSDYTDALGHSFSNDEKYCLNGCGEINPDYSEAVIPNPSEATSEDNQSQLQPTDIPPTENNSIDTYSGSTETEYKDYRIVPCYNQIKVAWESDLKLEGYEVFVSTSKDNGFEKVAEVEADNNQYYIINNLESGKIYYVKIIGYLTYNDRRVMMGESPIKSTMVK
ncbi:MAG: leucine-rich repeat domain-containing protein [Eubacterium sp.]